MIEEVWKDVIGYDYKYQISNYGNFRCLNSFHKKRIGIIFNQNKDSHGYLRVAVSMNGKTKLIKSHRVVATYFLDDYSEDLTVNHKDFNKENNNVSNLEMLTLSENILHHKLNVIKKESSSKTMGVGFHKSIGKWTSRVNIDGKRYSLGTYNTEHEAILAVKNKHNIFVGQGVSKLIKLNN